VGLREADRPEEDQLPPHWSRNPWGRTVLGVLIAQGLYYALRNLLFAGMLVVAPENEASQGSLVILLTNQALQLVALFLGSVLAGAGQRGGGLYGSMVGVWNGIICMMIMGLQGEPVTPVLLYSLPLLQAAIGAFGGVIGSWIWQPAFAAAPVINKKAAPVVRSSALFELTSARVHWIRVLIGVAIAAGGYMWADTILHLVLKTGEGHMTLRASIQHTVLTLEISALAVFVGGAFAGATTWNGAAQGAWMALLTAAIFLGYQLGYKQVHDLATLGLYVGGILALGLLGGSFGGRLLPPIIAPTSTGPRCGPIPV
jgi:hypothetical protein